MVPYQDAGCQQRRGSSSLEVAAVLQEVIAYKQVVLLDVKKADSVWYAGLFVKLHEMGE